MLAYIRHSYIRVLVHITRLRGQGTRQQLDHGTLTSSIGPYTGYSRSHGQPNRHLGQLRLRSTRVSERNVRHGHHGLSSSLHTLDRGRFGEFEHNVRVAQFVKGLSLRESLHVGSQVADVRVQLQGAGEGDDVGTHLGKLVKWP